MKGDARSIFLDRVRHAEIRGEGLCVRDVESAQLLGRLLAHVVVGRDAGELQPPQHLPVTGAAVEFGLSDLLLALHGGMDRGGLGPSSGVDLLALGLRFATSSLAA